MMVWYPTPRRLASRLAQAKAFGCRRMETGILFTEFAEGRPRLAKRKPNCLSRASRKTACSSGVKRRAREKSKGGFSGSIFEFIVFFFIRFRNAGADNPATRSIVAPCISDYQYPRTFSSLRNALSDDLKPLIRTGRMLRVGDHQRVLIIKHGGRFFKRDAVLPNVTPSFKQIPLKIHFNCIYNKQILQAPLATLHTLRGLR